MSNKNDMQDIFGEVIYSYTRAQAIEDGVLADLTALAPDVCRQHFKHPVACTAAVWEIIEKAVSNKKHSNDVNGIVHDILFMSKQLGQRVDPSTRIFPVIIKGAGPQTKYIFKIVCGPGDNAEPVMTVMLPSED